jgi:hypothetical protein
MIVFLKFLKPSMYLFLIVWHLESPPNAIVLAASKHSNAVLKTLSGKAFF